MTFHVGQKVVCVDDAHEYPGTFPVKGQVYTIQWIGDFRHPLVPPWSGLAVHLKEIIRPHGVRCRVVVPYRASRFRPVIERKTSIEIFTAMLNPVKPVKVSAPTTGALDPRE